MWGCDWRPLAARSCEPQKALHKRIAFCLQMHNDTVKAMAYPDENDIKALARSVLP